MMQMRKLFLEVLGEEDYPVRYFQRIRILSKNTLFFFGKKFHCHDVIASLSEFIISRQLPDCGSNSTNGLSTKQGFNFQAV
jgi:hypothetical protein